MNIGLGLSVVIWVRLIGVCDGTGVVMDMLGV